MSCFQPVFIKRLSIVTLYQMAKLFRFLQIPATTGACWFAFFRPRHISIYKPFLIICPEKLLTTRDFGKETTSSTSRRRVGPDSCFAIPICDRELNHISCAFWVSWMRDALMVSSCHINTQSDVMCWDGRGDTPSGEQVADEGDV